MLYVDGFIAPVPTANKDAYCIHAQSIAKILKECGAVSVVECWGDDVPEGEVNSMLRAVHLRAGETVVFSWIVWPDKATRQAGLARFRADPRVRAATMPVPFDGKRLISGGFNMVVAV